MSEPLSREELDFLARFARLPEGMRYLKYLETKMENADSALRSALRDDVFTAQGRARALHELWLDIKEAEKRLDRAVGSRRIVQIPS